MKPPVSCSQVLFFPPLGMHELAEYLGQMLPHVTSASEL